jgi:hypothetical protein
MAKVAFGSKEVAAEVVGYVKEIGAAAAVGNSAWLRLGAAVGARPEGVSLSGFAKAVADRCADEGVDAPGLNIGYMSKAEKTARLLTPLGIMSRGDALRRSQRVLYTMARAVEEKVLGETPTIDELLAWIDSGGELEKKRGEKDGEKSDGEKSDGEKSDGEKLPEIDVETAEALRMLREGAAAAGLSLMEFTKKAVAAALAG